MLVIDLCQSNLIHGLYEILWALSLVCQFKQDHHRMMVGPQTCIHFYSCTIVPLYSFTFKLLYSSTFVFLYYCLLAPMYSCTSVLLYSYALLSLNLYLYTLLLVYVSNLEFLYYWFLDRDCSKIMSATFKRFWTKTYKMSRYFHQPYFTIEDLT